MPDLDIKDENYRYRGFTGTLDLIFPENSVKFDEELLTKAIQDYINKYQAAGYKVTNINLQGWASMGGKEDYNQRLSERRAQAVYDDLIKGLADTTIAVTFAGMGEDWDRFKLLTKTSNLSGDEQAAALQIAGTGETNDEKEAQMRLLPFWGKAYRRGDRKYKAYIRNLQIRLSP